MTRQALPHITKTDHLPPLERQHLQTLDKEKLIDLLLQMHQQLQNQHDQLQKQQTHIHQQAARITTLEHRLQQNSNNSSRPPSSDSPFDKAHPKKTRTPSTRKTGGQSGHEGHGLHQVAVPDHYLPHHPTACEHCGYGFGEGEVAFSPCGTWQVHDLPQALHIEVTQHQRFEACCPWCQQCTQAPLPAWLSPQTPCQWGPHCRTLGVYLMAQQHLPYGRTQCVFVDLFGAAPSQGSLYRWQEQAYQILAPVEQLIADALVHSEQVGADETPVRGVGWLHCLVNEGFTWYGADAKRGREAMERFGLLPRFCGLLMSDFLSSYSCYGESNARCNAHLLRDLEAVEQAGHRWALRLRALLLSAKKRVEQTGAPLARGALLCLYRGWGKALALGDRENGLCRVSQSAALVSRLRRHRDEYLRFASVPSAWFDNNISERALRMMKLHVKVSGCFRSSLSCAFLCRLRGYLSTMGKQGVSLFGALLSVMECRPLLPPLLRQQAAN